MFIVNIMLHEFYLKTIAKKAQAIIEPPRFKVQLHHMSLNTPCASVSCKGGISKGDYSNIHLQSYRESYMNSCP